MKITHYEKIEDCFDGSAVFSYEVSEPWTADNVLCLAPLGELELFRDFPRPLFRLRTPGGLFVSGVVGGVRCRVTLPRTGREKARQQLLEVFE